MRPPLTNPQTDRSRRPLSDPADYRALVELVHSEAAQRLALSIYARTVAEGANQCTIADAWFSDSARGPKRLSVPQLIRARRVLRGLGLVECTSSRYGITYRVLRMPAAVRRRLHPPLATSQESPAQAAAAPPLAPGEAPAQTPPTPIYPRTVPAGTPDPDTGTELDHHHHVLDGVAHHPTQQTDPTPLPQPPIISAELLDRLRRIRWHGDPSSLTPEQLRRLPEHLADAERDGREPARLLTFRLAHDLGPAADVGPGESLPPRIRRPHAVSLELAVGRPRTTPMLASRPDCEINIDAEEAYDADAQRRVEGMPAASRDALLAEVREIARRRYQADPRGWDWTGPMAGATFAAAREILVERGEIPSLRAWCAARAPARDTAVAGNDQRRAS